MGNACVGAGSFVTILLRVLLGVALRTVSEPFMLTVGGSTCPGLGVRTEVAIGFQSACVRACVRARRLAAYISQCPGGLVS